jgi:hypothetical protein
MVLVGFGILAGDLREYAAVASGRGGSARMFRFRRPGRAFADLTFKVC